MADTENNKLVFDVCNEYKKENISLKQENEKLNKKILRLEKINGLHQEKIDEYEEREESYFMCFDNEDELAEYVEDSIDRYINSGHITSTITYEKC
jgi:hypothetical protein